MPHEEDPHDWKWYHELFRRELKISGGGHEIPDCLGAFPDRLIEIGAYYLERDGVGRIGREILVETILCSADELMRSRPLSAAEDDVLERSVRCAMADPYARDLIRPHWETSDTPRDPNPVGKWLWARYPAWRPPRSVWLEDAGS